MHAIINGRHYDTALATAIAIEDPLDGSEELYQTRGGTFFLVANEKWLDGRRLKRDEDLHELAPELQPLTTHVSAQRKKRIKNVRTIIPLTRREALIWSIRIRVPKTFQEYLLDVI